MGDQPPSYAFDNDAAAVGYGLRTGGVPNQQQQPPQYAGYGGTGGAEAGYGFAPSSYQQGVTPGGPPGAYSYQQQPTYGHGGDAPGAGPHVNVTVGGVAMEVPIPDKQTISGMASNAFTAAQNYQVPESVKTAVKTTLVNSAAAVKDAILSREYKVAVARWLYEGWEIYKQKWWAFSLLYLFILVLPWIPIVRWITPILVLPIFSGMYIATCNHLRTGNPIRIGHLFHGILFLIPLTIATILMSITIALGFFLCLIPGLFLMVTLAFTPYVYIEYYCNGLSVVDCMILSVKMTTRHFFLVALYLIVSFLFSFAGILLLGVGILVTLPVANISCAFAVQEIFGLNMAKTPDAECIVGF